MSKYRRFRWPKGPINIIRLVPNIITISGLCIGFTSIKLALEAKWEFSILCVIIAVILDGIDGKIARLLKAATNFGSELDSLSDFVNFGVVPMLLYYTYIQDREELRSLFWSVTLFYIICTAIRLARFNTMAMSKEEDKIFSNFFVGVPAPAGAILALTPIISEFEIKNIVGFSFFKYPLMVAIYLVFIAILMASRIPTFSVKNFAISPQNMWLFFIGFGFLCIGLILYTWLILPVLSLVYLVFIPIYYKRKKTFIV